MLWLGLHIQSSDNSSLDEEEEEEEEVWIGLQKVKAEVAWESVVKGGRLLLFSMDLWVWIIESRLLFKWFYAV